ncbi:MAG: hypothetical protein HC820_06605 [Hydrococcus sp. RM1_1_31]|nr:hypothetical protein [Hydrococcus sp. RM1_1_31]
MKPQKLLNILKPDRLLMTVTKKLGQKFLNLEKRTQWLAWIELLLRKIVVRAIANAKIFIQNLQQVKTTALRHRFDDRRLSKQQRTLVYLNLFYIG